MDCEFTWGWFNGQAEHECGEDHGHTGTHVCTWCGAQHEAVAA